jgi:putative tricarboxylic transport membrane protein
MGQRLSRSQRRTRLAALREQHGLYPFALTGAALDDYVQAQIKAYQQLADGLGLRRWKP